MLIPITWFVIAVAAVVVSAAWTYLMHRTVFRNRATRPVSIRWVVASALIVGLLYVGTAVTLGLVVNILDPGAAASQFLSLFIVVVTWGLILTLILDSQWRFRVQRDILIQQSVQQQLASVQELDVMRDIRTSVHNEVGYQIKSSNAPLLSRIDGLVDAGEADVGALAKEIHDTAERTVRPLSHELEDRARRRHRTPGFFTALVNIVRYQPFRPIAVSIVYVVTATPREINLHGATFGFGIMLVTVAFIFAIMTPLNQAMDRWPAHRAPVYLVGLVLIQVPTVLLTPIREQVTGESITVATLAVTAVFGTFVVIATSSFGSWNRTRREVIADFQREVDADTIATLVRGEALAKATMEAAMVLHGSVQSQLHACAMVIEEAARKGDMVEVNRALMQARAILEQPLPPLEPSGAQSLADRITQIAQAWRGLLAVRVDIDPAAASLEGPLADHLASIVEEGIANAVHHGHATQVAVEVTADDAGIQVTLLDNGDGPSGGSPGLGSTILGRYGSQWILEAVDDGTRLVVRVPQVDPLRVD